MGVLPPGTLRQRHAALRERIRNRMARELPELIKLWERAVKDDGLHYRDRSEALGNLCDRFGYPRMTAVRNLNEEVVPPKVILHEVFEPPASFNPHPPSGAVVEEHEAPPEAPPHTNGEEKR